MRTVEVYSPEQLSMSRTVDQFTLGQYNVRLMSMDFHNPIRYYIKLERTTQGPLRKRVAMLSKSNIDFRVILYIYDRLIAKIKDNQHAEITL